jgi:hypothetical protein
VSTVRGLSAADSEALRVELDTISRKYARPAAGDDAHAAGDGSADAILARAMVMEAVRRQAEDSVHSNVVNALRQGADHGEVAQALGITRQAAEKRWRYARLGMKRVAVVIARRARVRDDGQGGSYGEVGGPDQYDSDRRQWRIGSKVRELARYEIVGVDGTVERVYPIDPDSWNEVGPGYWEFRAIGDRECTDAEIAAAYAAGDLPLRPGDACPTRVGGAYRPHWF